jgi:uncharacterized protein YndB with AHSA1/START domain
MIENPGMEIIEKKVLIQAAPGVIFRALTDARDLAQWFCDRATSDPRVGGELKAYWRLGGDGQPQRGRAVFAALTPDARVELHWMEEGNGEGAAPGRHTISYTIHLKRGTAEVSVRDEGPSLADEESLEALNQGWISVLRDLKEHCESKQRSTRRQYISDAEGEGE